MTRAFLYPSYIEELRQACRKHLGEVVSTQELQATIRVGEQHVVALEEKQLRSFLTDMEADLELILFTVDEDKQLDVSKAIARKILTRLEAWERDG